MSLRHTFVFILALGATAFAAGCNTTTDDPAPAASSSTAKKEDPKAQVIHVSADTTVRVTGDIPYDDPTAQSVPKQGGTIRFDLVNKGETVGLTMKVGQGPDAIVRVTGIKRQGTRPQSVGDPDEGVDVPLSDLMKNGLPDGATPAQKQALDDMKDNLDAGDGDTCKAQPEGDGDGAGGGAKFRDRSLSQILRCIISVTGASCSMTWASITCGVCIASLVAEPATAGASTVSAVPSCVACCFALGASPAMVINAVHQCR